MKNACIGIVFFACLFLGFGLGSFFGNFEAGGTVGLGIGLGVIAAFRARGQDNK